MPSGDDPDTLSESLKGPPSLNRVDGDGGASETVNSLHGNLPEEACAIFSTCAPMFALPWIPKEEKKSACNTTQIV